MDKSLLKYTKYTKEKYFQAFLLGFSMLLLSLLPVMICDQGYFIYYGDFNAQQIPFYNLANDAVRSGQFGWNWYTDLGSDLLTSYSFYLSASPFFWLSTLLPRGWVTFSIPVLLALKHGVASLTAYTYIRRFVRSKEAALTGAMLYTFSGFQIFNIFFNHFQDVTALFPLMLIAMEENINNRRRGWFALIVAVMGALNYYFFTGEAVFLVLYFLVRVPCSDFRVTWKKFFGLLFEAIIGTGIACVVLLPSAIAILGNYRIKQRIYGTDWIIYYEPSRIFRIIQTFFMPSDAPARPNLFKSDGAKWSSVGGYFPMFSMLGVITFLRTRKKHWAVKLSVICIICSMIPILNCMYYTFNASYYARWFFMPILIFAMMTAQALDDENADFKPAVKFTAVMLAVLSAISLIPEKEDDKLKWFAVCYDTPYFWVQMAIAVLSLIFAVYILSRRRKGMPFTGLSVYSTSVACVVCTLAMVVYGAATPANARDYIESAIKGGDSVYEKVSEDNFFRVDISENCDNYPMLWKLPSMRAFQSVVSTSIMDFYDNVGVKRDVASRADITHYSLRGLLSVKYFYREINGGLTYDELKSGKEPDSSQISGSTGINASKVDVTKYLKGFKYVGKNDHFEIYENTLYVPMGFGYDTYMSEKDAAELSKASREKILMKALILSDEQIEKYGGLMKEISPTMHTTITADSYERFCREKQKNCADSFRYDSHGFAADISLDSPQLVFFSVPYSSGWTAEVNGQAVDVEKVSYGFMAVKCNAGENKIDFHYVTPGLEYGYYITSLSVFTLILYWSIMKRRDKKRRFSRFSHSYGYDSYEKIPASEVYVRSFIKK
jgi:uncharacterized membrane protein YfhO